MNKKLSNAIILFLILVFILLMIRYSNKENVSSVTSTDMQKDFKVYLITIDKTDRFWHELDQGASDMAELLGISYIWDAPEVKDIDRQIEILNKAVDDGANLIMLAANDPVAIVQYPYTMGFLGMAEAYAALNGKDTGPPFINTGVSILRKRN